MPISKKMKDKTFDVRKLKLGPDERYYEYLKNYINKEKEKKNLVTLRK